MKLHVRHLSVFLATHLLYRLFTPSPLTAIRRFLHSIYFRQWNNSKLCRFYLLDVSHTSPPPLLLRHIRIRSGLYLRKAAGRQVVDRSVRLIFFIVRRSGEGGEFKLGSRRDVGLRARGIPSIGCEFEGFGRPFCATRKCISTWLAMARWDGRPRVGFE